MHKDTHVRFIEKPGWLIEGSEMKRNEGFSDLLLNPVRLGCLVVLCIR